MEHVFFWISIAGALGLALTRAIQQRNFNALLSTLALLGVTLGLLTLNGVIELPWASLPSSRGGNRPTLILALYLSMLAGMAAHYLFQRLRRPRRLRKRFDLGNFIAPIFVSPIVFLPLASVFNTFASEPLAEDASRLMLFLVSFENGFFWREFFENRQHEARRGDHE